MARENVLGRPWQYQFFGQHVGIWKGHDKDQAKSHDNRGAMGYLLDIDIWQNGTTRIMQDGKVVKGLAPQPLDPLRYHVNPRCDLNELERGVPWRTVQDEFGKIRWIDHEGRMYQGTPYTVEPDATARMVFIANMVHAHMEKPVLSETPDVTCSSDVPDSERREEVVQHEVPGHPRLKKNSGDKKSTFTIEAMIPVTSKAVTANSGQCVRRG